MTIKVKVTNEETDEMAVIVIKTVSPSNKPIPNHPYRELKGGESEEFTVYGAKFLQISELNVNQ